MAIVRSSQEIMPLNVTEVSITAMLQREKCLTELDALRRE
jgi:hypothetical protein